MPKMKLAIVVNVEYRKKGVKLEDIIHEVNTLVQGNGSHGGDLGLEIIRVTKMPRKGAKK